MKMQAIDVSLPKGAIFSDNRQFRYVLWRCWNPSRPPLAVIGLNPSSANEIKDDATITRLMGRAGQNGFGSLLMGNLYAFVSTNPDLLLSVNDTVGIHNDDYLKMLISMAGRTLCGWGSFKPVKRRSPIVLAMIKEPYCLGVNADGQPKHPLYVSYDTPMVRLEAK